MGKDKHPVAKGCGILAAVFVGIPLLAVCVVGVQTCVPLQRASNSLANLELSLGKEAEYIPEHSGEIPANRMEIFLDLRAELIKSCSDYSAVQEGFESVDSLEEKDPEDLGEVGGVAADLGGAALAITPFLARFFEARNAALLEASMSLQEYTYIYALSYHQQLLSAEVRQQIFSDGVPLPPEASIILQECLTRQRLALPESDTGQQLAITLATEIQLMNQTSTRLIWQDGLPKTIASSLAPYRDRLDGVFCSATAGLEMEQSSGRAIRIALE